MTAVTCDGLLHCEVELNDGLGRRSRTAVQMPARCKARPGVLIGLHGAGGSGPGLLPWLAPLAEQANMAVVCPTAAAPAEGASNLDLAGLMGRRFSHPRWLSDASDFPLLALDWAVQELDVDARRTVMLGYSMGAVATWALGLNFASRFAGLVPISGAVSMWERFGPDHKTQALLPNLLGLPIFALNGEDDSQFPPGLMEDAARRLRTLGHDRVETHRISGAGHALPELDLRPGTEHFEVLSDWLAALPRRTEAREALMGEETC